MVLNALRLSSYESGGRWNHQVHRTTTCAWQGGWILWNRWVIDEPNKRDEAFLHHRVEVVVSTWRWMQPGAVARARKRMRWRLIRQVCRWFCNPIDERRPSARHRGRFTWEIYIRTNTSAIHTGFRISAIPYIFTRVSHRRARVIYANTRARTEDAWKFILPSSDHRSGGGSEMKRVKPRDRLFARRINICSSAVSLFAGTILLPGGPRNHRQVMFVHCRRARSFAGT